MCGYLFKLDLKDFIYQLYFQECHGNLPEATQDTEEPHAGLQHPMFCWSEGGSAQRMIGMVREAGDQREKKESMQLTRKGCASMR